MRVLPQRWWSVLFLGAIGAVLGATIAARVAAGSMFYPVVMGAGAGFGVGVTLGLLSLVSFIEHDTRLLALRSRHLDDIVIQALVDPENKTTLRELSGRPFGDLSLGSRITLVAGSTGITAWLGGRAPHEFAALAWSEIAELSVGEFYKPAGFGSYGYPRLVIGVSRQEVTSDLRVGIQFVPKWYSSRPALNHAEVTDLVSRLETLRQSA